MFVVSAFALLDAASGVLGPLLLRTFTGREPTALSRRNLEFGPAKDMPCRGPCASGPACTAGLVGAGGGGGEGTVAPHAEARLDAVDELPHRPAGIALGPPTAHRPAGAGTRCLDPGPGNPPPAGPRGPTGGGGPPHIPQQTPWPATQPVARAATPRGQPRRRSGCRPQKPKTSVRKLMSVIGCTENSHLPDECARCAARPRGLARGATVPRRCQTHQSALRHSCGGGARPIAIVTNSQD